MSASFYSVKVAMFWRDYHAKEKYGMNSWKSNPNGLSLKLFMGMDAGNLVIHIMSAKSVYSFDIESGFGGQFNNQQEMKL
jgi:hypothetical protein